MEINNIITDIYYILTSSLGQLTFVSDQMKIEIWWLPLDYQEISIHVWLINNMYDQYFIEQTFYQIENKHHSSSRKDTFMSGIFYFIFNHLWQCFYKTIKSTKEETRFLWFHISWLWQLNVCWRLERKRIINLP